MMSEFWEEDQTREDYVRNMQALINSGTAWRLEGSFGRAAMRLIEDGLCALGPDGHRDYYGNYVPSRNEVQDGTKGSVGFVKEHSEFGGVLDE